MAVPILVLKTVVPIFASEESQRAVGWVLITVLPPIILPPAFLCTTLSGGVEHNRTVADLRSHGGVVLEDTPKEYQAYIQEMRDSLVSLDTTMQIAEGQMEDGDGPDDVRVKAAFSALYFGVDDPVARAGQAFVDCFVTYEERTRTVTIMDEEGNEVGTHETYTVAVSISDSQQVWQNIQHLTGAEATPEQQVNADSICSVVKYGASTGMEGWVPGTDVPFVGADGFCSPIGTDQESRVASEFGYRRDPFTGETRGYIGMDLAVPTGTPVRAALSGTIVVAQYHNSYGYYVMIDHGNGLFTLYAHNSQLLVRVGQMVEAGDIVSLSGSTGQFTDPYLHSEMQVGGQRTNPGHYLPTTSYEERENMNSTQNTACSIAAHETAAGLPDNEWIIRADGTWKPRVTEQQAASPYRQAQALLAPETKLLFISRESLIGQTWDALLSRELPVGDTVLFAVTEPYGGSGDFAFRGGVIQFIDPERKTCPVQGRLFPMDDVPLHYVLRSYGHSVSEEHYGPPRIHPLLGEHPELAEQYLRETEARWNTLRGQPAVPSEAPRNTMQAMGGIS